ncbi:hypothetical protein V6N12_041734 [Hibiscus sabdariffa]|uniref:Protein FAR1-RELATED SEQUENCE n=1 Tax=Hibiscus sabdariffa TaxID=183260 RepID=A0ABR2A1P0_9ROSI
MLNAPMLVDLSSYENVDPLEADVGRRRKNLTAVSKLFSAYQNIDFLEDETVYTFLWLMQTWFIAMGERAPQVMLTDQNNAI